MTEIAKGGPEHDHSTQLEILMQLNSVAEIIQVQRNEIIIWNSYRFFNLILLINLITMLINSSSPSFKIINHSSLIFITDCIDLLFEEYIIWSECGLAESKMLGLCIESLINYYTTHSIQQSDLTYIRTTQSYPKVYPLSTLAID